MGGEARASAGEGQGWDRIIQVRFCKYKVLSETLSYDIDGTMKVNRFFSLVMGWIGLSVAPGLTLAADPAPALVKDIYSGELPKGLDPLEKVVAGNKVFMSGLTDTEGTELWVSDGTAAGTRLVKDLYPGELSGLPRGLTVLGERIVFVADTPDQLNKLWITDGTAVGTSMVRGLGNDEPGSTDMVLSNTLRVLGDSVIFAARVNDQVGIWKSDGTVAGTVKLKNFEIDADTFYDASWQVAGSNLYFAIPKEDFTTELWKTNGTSAGTTRVKNLGDMITVTTPRMLGAAGSTLYFAWETLDHGMELWKSNGTSAGTVMVKDIDAGEVSSSPRKMVTVGSKGYFLATTTDHGEELWVTDGTSAGTSLLYEAAAGDASSEFGEIVAMGDKVLVPYNNGIYEDEDYTYNVHGLTAWDTVSNTPVSLFDDRLLEEEHYVVALISAASKAFFIMVHGGKIDLWATDGTQAATFSVNGLIPEVQMEIMVDSLVAGTGKVFFNAYDAVTGRELWQSDGTEAGTGLVKNVIATGLSSQIRSLVTQAGHVYFSAKDGVHGRELWRSDGTAGGTHLVKDIRPGQIDSSPRDMVEMGGLIYFWEGEPSGDLWSTDGTEAGTQKVQNVISGFQGGEPLVVVHHTQGDRLYLTARTPTTGSELWVTDGTSPPTVLTEGLNPGTASSAPGFLTAVGNRLYFSVTIGSEQRLYYTEGGAPVQVASGFLAIREMVMRPPVSGALVQPESPVLYFIASKRNGGTADCSLYRCSAGEEPLELRRTPGNPFGINNLQVTRSLIFFESGGQIWRTDGTGLGTLSLSLDQRQLFRVTDDRIYYGRYYSTAAATELWSMRLDGSDPVKCITGMDYYLKGATLSAGKTLFFSNGPYTGGRRTFWSTQGTPETTRQIPGIISLDSGHEAMTVLGDRLHLVAFQEAVGEELFSFDIGGRLEVELLTDTAPLSLAAGATVDMGLDTGAGGLTRTLRLRNTGDLPLSNLSLPAPGLPDFSFNPALISTLPGGAWADIQVTFTAQEPGLRQTPLVINAQRQASSVQLTFSLSGRGISAGDKPFITDLPPARLAILGQPLQYQTAVGSLETPVLVWKRGTTTLGTEAVLSIASASASDVGVYTLMASNEAGPTTSNASFLGTLTAAPAQAVIGEGQALTLTCTAKAPAGATLSYLWRFNGAAVDGLVPGASDGTKPTLKVSGMTALHAGNYDCLVTLTAPGGSASLSAGATAVNLLFKPDIVLPAQPLVAYAGADFSYAVETTMPATRFTAKGLPAGLKISPAGVITGRPAKSGKVDPETGLPAPSVVTLTAGNAVGTGAPTQISLQVLPLLQPGSYDGLIGRQADLDEGKNLGSRVSIQITSTGAFSGQLTHGTKSYRFASAIVQPPDGESLFLTDRVTVAIPRAKGLSPLTLTFALNAASPELILANDNGDQAEGILRRVAFSSSHLAPAVYQSYFTHHVQRVYETEYAGQDHLFPGGLGYLLSSISKTGIVTWKGKLADGSVIIGSSALCVDGEDDDMHRLVLRQDLYKGLGSMQGWGRVYTVPNSLSEVEMRAEMDWYKAALPATSKERNYKDGFPVHGLMTWGGKYVAPNFKAGETLLGLSTETNGVTFAIELPGILPVNLTQNFTLGPNAKVTLPKWDGTTAFVKSLSFNAAQGTFKGSYSVKDPNPAAPTKPFVRTVNFEGALLGPAFQAAAGFSLVPDLPEEGPPSTSLTTSPLRSGSVGVY